MVKLTASDAAANDNFGRPVSISGDTAIVGAPSNDDAGVNSGSAYIFQRDLGGLDNWGEVNKLTASDAAAQDDFGWSVSISSDMASVGAIGNSDYGSFSGSAYIFQRDLGGADNWGEVTNLTASDAAAGDQFGRSVSISGDIAIVGANLNDIAGLDSGAAYIYFELPVCSASTIRYVSAVRPDDSGDGLSWATAKRTLQASLQAAVFGDQIWVASGTYRPDDGGGNTLGDRTETFQLLNCVSIYGGFDGGETILSQRDPAVNETILSGDLLGDDSLVACGNDSPDCDSNGNLCGDDGFCIIRNPEYLLDSGG